MFSVEVASGLAVLERDQLTDEVEGEKELEVKALGEELAGELGLGQGHLMRFVGGANSQRPRLLLTLAKFFFRYETICCRI